MLETGTKAPDFELPDQNGNMHKLSDYAGKKVILYFYPKDNTAGCTTVSYTHLTSVAVLFSCKKLEMEGIMKQVKEMGIVAVCLMLLGFGICMGIGTYLMYRNGEEEYDTLREYVAVEELKENADGETPEKNQKETVTVDFEALKKINSEIIAWIRIPDTKIDYPVVQGTDNEFYLKHTFKKTEHVADVYKRQPVPCVFPESKNKRVSDPG